MTDTERVDQPATPAASSRPAHLATSARWWIPSWAEAILAIGLGACVLLVHDVPYLLRTPYWLDEAWVALSTRTPISHLMTVSSSTPIGWSELLRISPGTGLQDGRLLPLLFAGLTAVAAYEFGRSLNLLPFVAGVLGAGAAVLVPAMLVRNDLKQYTADAFVTVLTLALVSQVEANWSRRRLAILGGALVASAFVSHVSLLVAAAALPCLTLAQVARRQWARAIEAAVTTAATGIVLGLVYLLFDGGTRTSSLRAYWDAYYLPHHLSAAYHYIQTHLHALLPYFGFDHAWLLFIFVLAGIVVLVVQGRWATAAIVPLLAIEMVVLSAARRYPLLDERTSTFLITASVVVAAIGVAGVATLLAGRVHLAVGIAAAAAAVAAYIPSALPYVDSHTIPYENVRAQAAYVDAHEGPADVVIVNVGASYGFAYYGSKQPQYESYAGIGFAVIYPAKDRIVAVPARGSVVQSGVAEALAMLSGRPGARLWVVLNHLPASEAQSWDQALAGLSLHAVEVAPATEVKYAIVGT